MKLQVQLNALYLTSNRFFSPVERELIAEAKGRVITPVEARFPLSLHLVRMLQRRFPHLDVAFDIDRVFGREDIDVSYLPLFPYQKEGVRFLVSRPGALLSFEPGLGKSATAISAADFVGAKRILVITLLSLLPTWEREISRWGYQDTSTRIIRGRTQGIAQERWILTNVDYLVRNSKAFQQHWDLVILDESIVVKERTTRRAAVLRSLRKMTDRLWMLSGAPISRDISDLWSQLNILDPKTFSSYWRFVNEYCVVQDTVWGKSILGSRPGIDWGEEFRDIVHVVSKEDAGLDLPDLAFEEVLVDLGSQQTTVYKRALDEFVLDLQSGEMAITTKLAQMVRLCQITSGLDNVGYGGRPENAKVDALLDLLGNGIVSKPLIIWTRFVPTAKRIVDELREHHRVALVIGETPTNERQAAFDHFGKGIDILVMSMSVGKYGLTFTQTRSMVYCDLDWNMETVYQSINRVHRIGLDHEPTVFRLTAKGTIDEFLLRNLRGKSLDLNRLTGDQLMKELLRDDSRD